MNPYTLPDATLQAMLLADAPHGDLTSRSLGIAAQAGRMSFRARQPMVVCGSEEARRMGELHGLRSTAPPAASGTGVAAGALLLTLEGEAAALHQVWKSAQTLIEYLSGIATATAELVAAARTGHTESRVACTRKNFPGTKDASLKAVLCAGAAAHRFDLSDTLLVFPEHLGFVDRPSPAALVRQLVRACPERKLVVEVTTVEDALAWADAGADVLQLEKMRPAAVADIARRTAALPRAPVIAAAGGVTAGNAADYARAGARVLVSSAPYQAPPRDVQVRFERS